MRAQESGRSSHHHTAGGAARRVRRRRSTIAPGATAHRPDVDRQHAVVGHQFPIITRCLSAERQRQRLDVGMIDEQPLRQRSLERVLERSGQLGRRQRIERVQ